MDISDRHRSRYRENIFLSQSSAHSMLKLVDFSGGAV